MKDASIQMWSTRELERNIYSQYYYRLLANQKDKTQVNDRDQFLMPTGEITEEFKNDCLIWMLFSNSNGTASVDKLKWRGQDWSTCELSKVLPSRRANQGS